LLTSRKVALVLLLAALALLLLGLSIPQVPAHLDETGRAQWWADMNQRYGSRLEPIRGLGLNHLYRTPLFLALMAALLLNTLACTLDRLRTLWRAVTRPRPVRLPDSAYTQPDWQAASLSQRQARRLLQRWRCRVRWEQGTAHHHAFAETGRLPLLGTVLTHLGLLLFVVAALFHTQLAWRERLVLDPAPPTGGEATLLRHLPTCGVSKIGGEVITDGDTVQDVRGQLVVYQGERAARRPLTLSTGLSACGARFFLDSYGLVLHPEAFDSAGQPLSVYLAEDGDTLLRFPEGQPEASFALPDLGLNVRVTPSPLALTGLADELRVRLDPIDGGPPLLESEVLASESIELPGGGRLSFLAGAFFVVEAVHDPGFPWFLAAGLALTVGSALRLLFPQRRLWARLIEDGTLQVRFGTRESQALAEEIRILSERMARLRGGAT
jgi:cytochrome c biogenesis protein ResB